MKNAETHSSKTVAMFISHSETPVLVSKLELAALVEFCILDRSEILELKENDAIVDIDEFIAALPEVSDRHLFFNVEKTGSKGETELKRVSLASLKLWSASWTLYENDILVEPLTGKAFPASEVVGIRTIPKDYFQTLPPGAPTFCAPGCAFGCLWAAVCLNPLYIIGILLGPLMNLGLGFGGWTALWKTRRFGTPDEMLATQRNWIVLGWLFLVMGFMIIAATYIALSGAQ